MAKSSWHLETSMPTWVWALIRISCTLRWLNPSRSRSRPYGLQVPTTVRVPAKARRDAPGCSTVSVNRTQLQTGLSRTGCSRCILRLANILVTLEMGKALHISDKVFQGQQLMVKSPEILMEGFWHHQPNSSRLHRLELIVRNTLLKCQ